MQIIPDQETRYFHKWEGGVVREKVGLSPVHQQRSSPAHGETPNRWLCNHRLETAASNFNILPNSYSAKIANKLPLDGFYNLSGSSWDQPQHR